MTTHRAGSHSQALHRAQHARDHDAHELHRDQGALKHDAHALQHDRDAFQHDAKAVKRRRAALGDVRNEEQRRLRPLEHEKAQLEQQLAAGDPAAQPALDALAQREAGIKGAFDPRIEARRADVDGLRADLDRLRSRIPRERTAVKHDHKEIAHDKKALAHDEKRIEELRAVPNVVGGQVGKWIAEAQTILKQHGVPLSKMNARDIAMIIQHESGGNPRIVNHWDSNAAAGHPSKGLMQTIASTFNEHKLPGHGHILNPVDNIIAGVRYAIAAYGSISNVPGVRAVHAGGSYVGY